MKLFVIVICLLSERFLIHAFSLSRFNWYNAYCEGLMTRMQSIKAFENPWLKLISFLTPLILVMGIVFFLFSHFFYGFIGLILNLGLFFYCLGPKNPFYPLSASPRSKKETEAVGQYLADINGQLFSVMFWYILAGPLGMIVYRVISLSRDIEPVRKQAITATLLLDWIPARLTVILYLLVGNFQRGLVRFGPYVLANSSENQAMLKDCGLASLTNHDSDEVSLVDAEQQVDYALITYLVLLAIFTLAAWL